MRRTINMPPGVTIQNLVGERDKYIVRGIDLEKVSQTCILFLE